MASKKIRGITIEIGGDTTKLGKALGDVEKKSNSLQSELREVEKLLKLDPTNVELLAQKQQILTSAVSETTAKLDTLKAAEAQVVAQFEKGDIGEDRLRAFQREILTTENKLDSLQTELAATGTKLSGLGTDSTQTKTALDKLNDEIDDQEKELSDLKDEYTNVILEQGKSSAEAKELAGKLTSLNSSLAKNKKALSNAEAEADDLATALDNAGDEANDTSGFTVMKGALADLTANAISSAVSAIGDFLTSLLELSEATEEYRSMQAKLSGSSETFGYSAEFAAEKYKLFYGYLGDDQMATNAITNLMGIGTSTESLSSIANGAIGVWASYGDSIPIESLTESINETVNAGKVTGTFADTINWCKTSNEQLYNALDGNSKAQKAFNKAIKNGETAEDAFNAALAKTTSEQERADIIAKFLNSTYGESKTAYDEMAGSIIDANNAELELKNTQAQLGEAVSPVNTALTSLKNDALVAITPLVQSLADGFMNVYNWLSQNPAAMELVKAAAIALGVAFGILATALSIQALINGVQKAFSALNLTMLSNPIVLIVAAIAGLVAAFMYLWNNCEGFRNFWINLWNGIKNACTIAFAWISAKVSAAWTWIQSAWAGAGEWFSGIWTSIQNVFSTVGTWFYAIFLSAVTWIKSAWSSVTAWFTNIWTNIKNAFANVGTWFQTKFTAAWTLIKVAWSGVKSWFSSVWTGITGIFTNVGVWFKNRFTTAWSNIKAVFSNWGSFFGGLWTTIKNKFTTIGTNLASAIGGAVKSGLNTVITWIENTINSGIGLINGAIDLINMIPGVTVGKLATITLPRLAQGGVVNSPTLAEIGEDGAEAVVPLEKNTGWIREVAKMMNAYQQGGMNNPAMADKLDRIYERLGRLQIVLDTGVLVGETIDQIDAGLADKQILSARRV